eukprot:10908633-Ditylum_brightwellii.AAC.1
MEQVGRGNKGNIPAIESPQPRKWLDKQSNTGWKYSPRTDEIFELSNGKWGKMAPVLEMRGRGSYRRYRKGEGTYNLLEDTQNVVCIGQGDILRATGWVESIGMSTNPPKP